MARRSAAQIAAQKKAAKASAAARSRKAKAQGSKSSAASADKMHGSGTGLTSAYRYLPVNVEKRRKAAAAAKSAASSPIAPMTSHNAPGGQFTKRLAERRSDAKKMPGVFPTPGKQARRERVGGRDWAHREATGNWPEPGQKVRGDGKVRSRTKLSTILREGRDIRTGRKIKK